MNYLKIYEIHGCQNHNSTFRIIGILIYYKCRSTRYVLYCMLDFHFMLQKWPNSWIQHAWEIICKVYDTMYRFVQYYSVISLPALLIALIIIADIRHQLWCEWLPHESFIYKAVVAIAVCIAILQSPSLFISFQERCN